MKEILFFREVWHGYKKKQRKPRTTENTAKKRVEYAEKNLNSRT